MRTVKRWTCRTKAAVLAHGIAERQVFFDGNKRTAWVALRTFLLLNGYRIQAPTRERYEWMIALSDSNLLDTARIGELAKKIQRSMQPISLDPRQR